MTSDSTRWPLPEERAPFATASPVRRTRKQPRSAWLLTALAFLCGGLVSAAAFSIGWRHQVQHDNATQTALAAATARTRRLERRVAGLQASLTRSHRLAVSAVAAEKALAGTGTQVAGDATAAGSAAASASSGAGSLTAEANRIASELKTLDTYLTTTPTAQLDPGYISTQSAYLAQQLTRLQGNAGILGNSVRSLEASLRGLSGDASGLSTH